MTIIRNHKIIFVNIKTDRSLITSIVGTDDHNLLQGSNLTVLQPCKASITFYIQFSVRRRLVKGALWDVARIDLAPFCSSHQCVIRYSTSPTVYSECNRCTVFPKTCSQRRSCYFLTSSLRWLSGTRVR